MQKTLLVAPKTELSIYFELPFLSMCSENTLLVNSETLSLLSWITCTFGVL